MKKVIIFILLLCVTVSAQTHKSYNSFSAGELSPYLLMREDLSKYHSGASVMENFIPLPQGPAQKRPGTKYVAGSKSNTKIRLLPFEYSTTDAFVIELGNQYARFFKDKAAVDGPEGTDDLSATGANLNNIKGHYLLDETIGTVVTDADGATHDGVLSVEAITVSTTGIVGTAFDLDGQYDVAITNHNDFSFTDDSDDSAFSIAAWGYVTNPGDLQVLVSKWRSASSVSEWRLSVTSDNKLQLHLSDSGTTISSDVVAQWKLNDDAADTNVISSIPQYTIDDADAVANTFTISDDGDLSTSFPDASYFTVEASTGNDGQYTVVSTAYGAPDFVITVAAVADGTDDGTAAPHAGVASANTSTLSATGKIGDSFDMGDAAYIIVKDSDDLSFAGSEFTFSAWVYYVANADGQVILNKHEYLNMEYVFMVQADNKAVVAFYDQSVGAFETFLCNIPITDGWHHIVATYGGTGGAEDTDIYIDNVSARGASLYTEYAYGAFVAMENLADDLTIGAYKWGAAYYYEWNDKIDNIMVFDVELSASEVSSLYNSGAGAETFSGTEVYNQSDAAVDDGWHLFTSTYSAPAVEATAATEIILYVDGAAVASTAYNSADYTAMQDSTENVLIGAQRNAGNTANEKFWADKIDEVSIYSDVLTPAEVASLYSESAYEIDTPYLTADLPKLRYKQSADVLFISHPDYETRKLSRFKDNSWTLDELAVENGPFLDENTDTDWTITPSATTGTITLTSSEALFRMGLAAGHLPSGSADTSKSLTGALFKIIQTLKTAAYEEILSDNYTDSTTEDVSWMDCGSIAKGISWNLYTLGEWTGTLEVQRNYTIGAAHGAATWETIYTFQSTDDRNIDNAEGEETEAEADYRVILTSTGDAAEPCQVYFTISDTDHAGIVEITGVTNATSAIGTVIETLADTSATHRWAEGAWSNYRGWPKTVTFFEDRLTFGGNDHKPDTIWTSVSSDYYNFLAGANDDDALIFTLSSRQVNVIEWLVGKEKLLIGTSGAEWSLSGEADEALSPSSFVANEHSNMGSAPLQAVVAGESVLFFQRGAEKMRELAYNWEIDSYISPDMTILAEHITGEGITDLGMQTVPNSIVWCVREDGQIALFVYDRKEQITSWSRIITDGEFESVAIVSGDPEDEVWVSVNRTIGGSTKRYIEYFSDRYFGTDVDDAYYVDCGRTYDSTATTSITNLGHLIAEEVYILGDGVIQTAKTVDASGDIAITSASTVQAGLPYTAQLKTMPLSFPSEGSTVLGRVKRINEVFPRYYNSGDFYIGRDTTYKELLSIDSMDTSAVDTDDNDRVTFPAGNDRYGYILVYQKSAEPLTLLSLIAEVN